jgi:hypothetical protein
LFFSTLHYYSQQTIQIIFLPSGITSLFYYSRANRKITIFSLSSFVIHDSSILTLFFTRSKHTLKVHVATPKWDYAPLISIFFKIEKLKILSHVLAWLKNFWHVHNLDFFRIRYGCPENNLDCNFFYFLLQLHSMNF